jgi:hypothetical protein
MVFLDTSPSGDLAEYRHKYLTGQAEGRTELLPADARESPRPSLEVNEADWPPLADPEVLRAKLPPSVRAYLEKALPIALQNFRERFPLLPGETIARDLITALTSDWNGAPKGTVIYQRQTNLGTIAFGIPTMTIDLQTGATSYATLEAVLPPEMPADLVLLEISDTDKTMIDAALTIAQLAGFALPPPYGVILSRGAAVLQKIFDQCMSKKHVPLSTQVADAVKAVGVGLNLENINATIGTDYDWLRNRYDAAWTDHAAPVSDDEYRDFKRHLSDKLAADMGIIHDVNLLNEPSYQIPGFPLYLLGASLVLLLMKIDLLIQSSEKSVLDTNAFTTLINTLKNYIKNAEATKAEIDKRISNRLAKISQVYRHRDCIAVPGPSGAIVSCNEEWGFTDGKQMFKFPDTSRDVGCKSQTVEHKAEATASRAAYYAKVHAQLDNQYYRGDSQKAADTIARWKEMLEEYQGYLPNK